MLFNSRNYTMYLFVKELSYTRQSIITLICTQIIHKSKAVGFFHSNMSANGHEIPCNSSSLQSLLLSLHIYSFIIYYKIYSSAVQESGVSYRSQSEHYSSLQMENCNNPDNVHQGQHPPLLPTNCQCLIMEQHLLRAQAYRTKIQSYSQAITADQRNRSAKILHWS